MKISTFIITACCLLVLILGILMCVSQDFRIRLTLGVGSLLSKQDPPWGTHLELYNEEWPLNIIDNTKTVSVDKHPYILSFVLYVEENPSFACKTDDLLLRIEAIKDDQVIGRHLIRGDSFTLEGSDNGVKTYSIAIAFSKNETTDKHHNFNQDEAKKAMLSYFDFLEPATYRLSVIRPIERYKGVTTTLRISGYY